MAGKLTAMAARHGAGWIVLVSLVLYIVASNVVVVRADKIDIPDEVLDYLRDKSDIGLICSLCEVVHSCNLLCNICPQCLPTTAVPTTSSANSTIETTTIPLTTTASHRNKTTTAAPTTSVTSHRPKNVTTASWTTPHANLTTDKQQTTSSHGNWTTPSSSNHTKDVTTAIPVTVPVVTTSSPSGHGDPFSYKWFFVGFAVMLVIVLIIAVVAVVVKKVVADRRAAREPSYSPL